MKAAVLGAGKQGLAIAYDLAKHGGATSLTLVEADAAVLRAGTRRLRRLLPGTPIRAVAAALRGKDAVRLLRGHAVAVSALPYRFNPAMARAAVAARTHFVDLGGTPISCWRNSISTARRSGRAWASSPTPASRRDWRTNSPPSPWARSTGRAT